MKKKNVFALWWKKKSVKSQKKEKTKKKKKTNARKLAALFDLKIGFKNLNENWFLPWEIIVEVGK